ncbi:MAG: molybdenum ABC transporter ATP-binding protein [Pseudomonadota bacterium]
MSLSVALSHRLGALSLDVAFETPGGVTALFGRSGAGKSTVVNAIAGLLRPERGQVRLDGMVLLDTDQGIWLPPHRRRLGYVFQDARLFPHLSVRGNLTFGARFAPRAERVAAQGDFDRVVAMLGIAPLLARRTTDLSGGERQRVAIGRALLARPRLLLLDEPLAALDQARKDEILPWIERLRDEAGLPIVYVSHSLAEVARLGTTIVALDEGRVARIGPAATVLSDPASFPLMGRQEAGAILSAVVVEADAGDGLSRLGLSAGDVLVPRVAAAVGSAVRLRVRARDVILALEAPSGISTLNALPVTVASVGDAEGGAIVEVGLTLGSERLLARITARSARALGLAPGMPCIALLKAIAVGRRDMAPAASEIPRDG